MAMKAKEDERKFILDCIEVYHSLPALWNVKSKNYSSRMGRKKKSVYDCTVEDVEYIYNKLSILLLLLCTIVTHSRHLVVAVTFP